MPEPVFTKKTVAIVGGGPAGLMAAESLIQGGVQVMLFDAMPSVGRKFLLAGKGGMNLTHAEPLEKFLTRYGARNAALKPLLEDFGPDALRAWAHELGIETFVGSSQRVFPTDMKAAPLLRAWITRLRTAGVQFHMRHRWQGWAGEPAEKTLRFETPDGERLMYADATILALGGGSWARLGSDGAWIPILRKQGIAVAALRPSNCGFDLPWSEHMRTRFAGHPVKSVIASCAGKDGEVVHRQGEFIITSTGVEGSLIYAMSSLLREQIASTGAATLYLDLLPGRSLDRVIDELAHPRGARSLSSHLQSKLGIVGVKAALLREVASQEVLNDPVRLGSILKALPLKLLAPRPLDEAISSAGGVEFEMLDQHLMLRAMPGVFCAGEMLDWEAPTGGYLLTACFASGHAAGQGALAWLNASENNQSSTCRA
ncbi:TIGR03862 family flavoprotein [Oxalobacteraceae bacterium R-40]|uniref:TIGR03862 family flavoprotein n=1 Tax=Keguizhuia sedimenti TaxID=3064264 RepID=A0ABU1BLG5_9BURK|nr:TIGR03862 family flavoprotein [Oxalobacteraceae bacterium R-40]